MPLRIVEDDTGAIAAWGFETWGSFPLLYNKSFGVIDETGIRGCILFTGYNGSEAEVHFLGPRALTLYTVRTLFRIAVEYFNLNRLVARTRKESMSRGCAKLGAEYEGVQRCVYGPTDEDKDTAQVWVFYRATMEKLAKVKK